MLANLIEEYYAQKFYPMLAAKISQVTGVFSFSIAELLVVGGILALLWLILNFLFRFFPGP